MNSFLSFTTYFRLDCRRNFCGAGTSGISYDSTYALAECLLKHFDEPLGLYANSSASKHFEGGKVQTVDRELLKVKLTQGRLKLQSERTPHAPG